MKIETILNAMQYAQTQSINLAMLERLDPYANNYILLGRRERQWQSFRARILRTVAIYRNFAEANGYREDQAWFWTDEWQAKEREVDKEIT